MIRTTDTFILPMAHVKWCSGWARRALYFKIVIRPPVTPILVEMAGLDQQLCENTLQICICYIRRLSSSPGLNAFVVWVRRDVLTDITLPLIQAKVWQR